MDSYFSFFESNIYMSIPQKNEKIKTNTVTNRGVPKQLVD